MNVIDTMQTIVVDPQEIGKQIKKGFKSSGYYWLLLLMAICTYYAHGIPFHFGRTIGIMFSLTLVIAVEALFLLWALRWFLKNEWIKYAQLFGLVVLYHYIFIFFDLFFLVVPALGGYLNLARYIRNASVIGSIFLSSLNLVACVYVYSLSKAFSELTRITFKNALICCIIVYLSMSYVMALFIR
ncbi:hypothetical protein ACFL4L_04020 [bacterium]